MDLLELSKEGKYEEIKEMIENGMVVDPCATLNDKGQNALMIAAIHGHEKIVDLMLEQGIPWNSIDKQNKCAGDYALENENSNIVEKLISIGCQAEIILSKIKKNNENNKYLKSKIKINEDKTKIIDEENEAVMMSWEAPLMEAHAEALSVKGGDVLNIGFGLGLFDKAVQKREPKTHTIIEAHPDIYEYMIKEEWHKKSNVKIIYGKWQDYVKKDDIDLGKFDAVFFDTYGEDYSDMQEFHKYLSKILKKDGVYSFFNGLAPDNGFFHLVYCHIVKIELSALGFETEYVTLPVKELKEEWKEIKNRYWYSNRYNLPVIFYK